MLLDLASGIVDMSGTPGRFHYAGPGPGMIRFSEGTCSLVDPLQHMPSILHLSSTFVAVDSGGPGFYIFVPGN